MKKKSLNTNKNLNIKEHEKSLSNQINELNRIHSSFFSNIRNLIEAIIIRRSINDNYVSENRVLHIEEKIKEYKLIAYTIIKQFNMNKKSLTIYN